MDISPGNTSSKTLLELTLALCSADTILLPQTLLQLDAFFGALCLSSAALPPSLSPSPTSSRPLSANTFEVVRKKWRVPSKSDPLFGEFVQLQDIPSYNLTSKLIALLHQMSPNSPANEFEEDAVILTLKNIQGCLLLHPPSRDLFQNENDMKVLLSFLSTSNESVPTICSAIQTLVSCLVRNVPNLRLFEKLDGPQIVCTLLNYKGNANDSISNASKEVQVKTLEFLFFYLVPETTKPSSKSRPNSISSDLVGGRIGSPSLESVSHSPNTTPEPNSLQTPSSDLTSQIYSREYKDGYIRRTTKDKAAILRQFLNKNITEGLVNELLENKPFGNMDNKW